MSLFQLYSLAICIPTLHLRTYILICPYIFNFITVAALPVRSCNSTIIIICIIHKVRERMDRLVIVVLPLLLITERLGGTKRNDPVRDRSRGIGRMHITSDEVMRVNRTANGAMHVNFLALIMFLRTFSVSVMSLGCATTARFQLCIIQTLTFHMELCCVSAN